MFSYDYSLRVRYVETDQMKVVYHGNYATYYEVGRVEAFRAFGCPYKELEDEGVMMPILEQTVRFRLPAHYDDVLTVRSIIEELPDAKMIVKGEIYNQEGKLINESLTTMAFLKLETLKPTRCPARLRDVLKQYFEH